MMKHSVSIKTIYNIHLEYLLLILFKYVYVVLRP